MFPRTFRAEFLKCSYITSRCFQSICQTFTLKKWQSTPVFYRLSQQQKSKFANTRQPGKIHQCWQESHPCSYQQLFGSTFTSPEQVRWVSICPIHTFTQKITSPLTYLLNQWSGLLWYMVWYTQRSVSVYSWWMALNQRLEDKRKKINQSRKGIFINFKIAVLDYLLISMQI